MTQRVLTIPLCLISTLFLTACGGFLGSSHNSAESTYIRTLQTQGLAQSYNADESESCNIKQRFERDFLYGYKMSDSRMLSLDADRQGSVMMRLEIWNNPFKPQTDCVGSSHRGLAASLYRETKSGTIQDISGSVFSGLVDGDIRGVAQNIDQEFGS